MRKVLKKTLVLMTFVLTFGIARGQIEFWVDSIKYETTSATTVQVNDAHNDIVYANIPASVTNNGVTYSVTNIEATIDYYNGTVTGAFEGCSGLTSVTIPNSVTTIGSSAFYNCSSLTSVTIPNSVTTIEVYAFYGCSSLASVTIPESVTTIGERAFWDCSSLAEVTCLAEEPPTLGYDVFGDTPENKTLNVQCLSIGAYKNSAWKNSFYEITGGNVVGDLRYCFSEEDNTAVVTSIVDKTATTVNIPATVTYEGNTYSVTTIGEYAFDGCSGLTSVTIPNSVTTIEGGTFAGCSSLTSVTIPEGVTTIEGGTFADCSSLTSVTIPNSVTTIRKYAFAGCSSLTLVTIPEGVTEIGFASFISCNALSSIVIPSTVTSIGESAFTDCAKLKKVTCLGEEPPALGYSPFYNTPANKTLTVPCNSVEAYNDSDWILHFINIVCDNMCDKPTNVSVSNITSNGATITWNGEAESYELQLNEGETESLAAKTKTYTDLQPATFYMLKVRAVCGESNSEWVTITFTTQAAGEVEDCGEPTNLKITGITETEATVSWDGTADAYEIQINDEEVETVTETSKTYTNLEAGTYYLIKVRSVCGENNSQWVTAMFFETLKGESGLNDAEQTMMISVYPNPIEANGNAVINLQGLNGKAKLMLMDAQGRVILNEDLAENTEKYEINTSTLGAGVYYLAIRTQNGIATEKLIVK